MWFKSSKFFQKKIEFTQHANFLNFRGQKNRWKYQLISPEINYSDPGMEFFVKTFSGSGDFCGRGEGLNVYHWYRFPTPHTSQDKPKFDEKMAFFSPLKQLTTINAVKTFVYISKLI